MKIKSLVGCDSDCEKRNYEASLEIGKKHTGKLSNFFPLYTILLETRFTSTTAFDSRRQFLNKLSFHIFFPIYFLPFFFFSFHISHPHQALSVPQTVLDRQGFNIRWALRLETNLTLHRFFASNTATTKWQMENLTHEPTIRIRYFYCIISPKGLEMKIISKLFSNG